MNLAARLAALERRVGTQAPTCPTCGPPPRHGRVLLRRIRSGKPSPPPIAYCPDCNGLLDEEGNPLGPHGSVVTLNFIRRELPPEE